MPQMKPMMWTILLFSTTALLFLTTILIHFTIFIPAPTLSPSTNKKMKFTYRW